MRLSVVSAATALHELAADWDHLAGGVPFRSQAWLASWWEHFGARRDLCVVVARDPAGQVLGIAPWYRETSATNGRTLAFLGAGEVCSDYLSLLVEPRHASEFVSALVHWLSDDFADQWDLLHLEGIAAGDETMAIFTGALTAAGLTVHEQPGLNTWRIEIESDWENYVQSLSHSHRKQVRRFVRRIVESGEAVLQRVERPEQLERGLAILIDLHQKRRQSLGEPGCFADPRFAGFIRAAAPRLLAAGMLRLYWVELHGQPIAAEFQLAGGGVTYAYQAGVDPEKLDEEPGRIINIATLRQAIADGQRAFDFLRGDEPYKAHWRAQPHASRELRIVPRKTTAQLRHNVWLAGEGMKRMIKGVIGKSEI